jgi:hypothetical protein
MRGQRTLFSFSVGLLLVVSLLFPSALWAEFYRYTGEDGAIHFTDDLNEVPPNQRGQVEAFSETKSAQPPAAVEKDPATNAADQARSAVLFLEEKRNTLVTRQEKLKSEYERLIKAREEIESLRQTADTPEKQRTLEAKVTALKAEVSEYEAQAKALDEEVKAFNQAVKAGSSPQAQPQ